MHILPVNNLTNVAEQSRHEERDRERQKRHQPERRKPVPPAQVYSPTGELEESSAPKIDMIV